MFHVVHVRSTVVGIQRCPQLSQQPLLQGMSACLSSSSYIRTYIPTRMIIWCGTGFINERNYCLLPASKAVLIKSRQSSNHSVSWYTYALCIMRVGVGVGVINLFCTIIMKTSWFSRNPIYFSRECQIWPWKFPYARDTVYKEPRTTGCWYDHDWTAGLCCAALQRWWLKLSHPRMNAYRSYSA